MEVVNSPCKSILASSNLAIHCGWKEESSPTGVLIKRTRGEEESPSSLMVCQPLKGRDHLARVAREWAAAH